MSIYKAIVHYHFKEGMADKGIQFLERELIKKAEEYGCHGIELWQNERNPSYLLGIGLWHDIEDARRFQSLWHQKEKELMRFCVESPKREFYKIKSTYVERKRKAA